MEDGFKSKRWTVFFSNKANSLYNCLTNYLLKTWQLTRSRTLGIFFPFPGFPEERLRDKEKLLFFPVERAFNLFQVPPPLPLEKVLALDFLAPLFLLAMD